MRTTIFGFTQMHRFIFSAVKPWPQRSSPFSGKITKGQSEVFRSFLYRELPSAPSACGVAYFRELVGLGRTRQLRAGDLLQTAETDYV